MLEKLLKAIGFIQEITVEAPAPEVSILNQVALDSQPTEVYSSSPAQAALERAWFAGEIKPRNFSPPIHSRSMVA